VRSAVNKIFNSYLKGSAAAAAIQLMRVDLGCEVLDTRPKQIQVLNPNFIDEFPDEVWA
jgi:hypothetical protein